MKDKKIFKDIDNRCLRLFDLIFVNGSYTNSELLHITKMKKSTLLRSMKILMENNLVVETAVGESTGGRRPTVFDVNINKYYLIGVDISRTYVDIVVTDLKMNVIKYKQLQAAFEYERNVNIISEEIISIYNEISPLFKVIGIGISIVGIEEKIKNNIISIEKKLSEKLNILIFTEHGASAAVMLEHHIGHGKGMENVSYINCGVGIRTGSICNGKLVKNIMEDALGHNIINIDGELCKCGNYGCLQNYVSIEKIKNRYISEMKKWKKGSEITYKDVCDLAEENDEIAKYIIKDAAVYFGTVMANFIKMLNQQLIILSGPLINNSNIFYDFATSTALKKSSGYEVKFIRGGYFENKSMAVGAAYSAFYRIMQQYKGEDI